MIISSHSIAPCAPSEAWLPLWLAAEQDSSCHGIAATEYDQSSTNEFLHVASALAIAIVFERC